MQALDDAIVIGGSMGGFVAQAFLPVWHRHSCLCSACVGLPGEHRRGVPQGRHTHGLLASGRDVLERLFPGISNDLIAPGAIAGDIVHDTRWCNEGGLLARFKSGLDGLLMTRPLLEGTVRQRVLALPNVVARQGFHVEALTVSEDRKRVTGVKDANIDTTGRGSSTPQWLYAIGYPKPVTRGGGARLHHAVLPPPPQPVEWRCGRDRSADPSRKARRRHAGAGRRPLDGYADRSFRPGCADGCAGLRGIRAHASRALYPRSGAGVRAGERADDGAIPGEHAAPLREAGTLSRGLPGAGDAISSFNPIYGQGMSVAALEAMELQAALAESSGNLARSFFRRAAKVVDTPWSVSVGNDLRMPETVVPRNAGVNFINWYMAKLNKAAQKDPVPAMAFFRVANLLAPPPSVMHPKVVWRVLLGNLRPQPVDSGADPLVRAGPPGPALGS